VGRTDGASVIVVTGLPRSGTSMMMQVLEAGGAAVLSDGLRGPDEDNPRGYYEFEPVKRTRQDPSWVDGASGKAVKLVYRLLQDLPRSARYKVLFMRRRLSEVYASQERMLRRRTGRPGEMEEASFERLFGRELQRTLAWLARQPHFEVLELDYEAFVADPGPRLREIQNFLGEPLETAAMLAAVEPRLRRQRRDAS
jgi:hypothetical protein